jgi:hypothetical protein
MKEDLVDTQWAREARAAVELAAKDLSAAYPCGEGCRIAWGFANNEDAASQERLLLQYRSQFGLLIYAKTDIDLKISRDALDDANSPNFMDLWVKFTSSPEQELLVPLSPQGLYNVLACLNRNVKLRLFPRREPERIFVAGAEASIPVEGITGRILYDAVKRLYVSRLAVDAISGEGDDWWNWDLQEERPA